VATIPVVVYRLGPARFGILSLAWVFVSYFAVFDLGLGRAATKHVAEALGARKEHRIPEVVWTAVLIQAALGVLGGLLLAASTPFLVGHLLQIPQPLVAEARSTFYVLSLSVLPILIAGSFRGVLEAAQRFDLVNAVRVPFGAANFLLPLIGVVLDWKLPGIVGLLLLSSGLATAAYFWFCSRVFPRLSALHRFHRVEVYRLLTFGMWITVSSILAPVLVYLDRFMVGTLVSIAAVGYYSAPYEMVTRLWIVPASLVSTLFPAFSTLRAQGGTDAFEALVSRSTKYLLLALGPVVIVFVAFASDILRLWLGSTFATASSVALQILAIGVLINSIAQIPYALIQAIDRPDLTAKFHLLETPLHIVVVWIAVGAFGITGAALAWSLRVTVDACLLFVAADRLSSLSLRYFLTSKIPHTVLTLALLAFAISMVAILISTKWLQVGLLGCLFVAFGASGWRYLLDDRDRANLIRVLRFPAMVDTR
jgi:O-antigen/teichoic acid export membrane protein